MEVSFQRSMQFNIQEFIFGYSRSTFWFICICSGVWFTVMLLYVLRLFMLIHFALTLYQGFSGNTSSYGW